MRRRIAIGAAVLAAVPLLSALASGAIVQEGNLRISVLGQIKPFKLPRDVPAPIAVFISGHVGTPDGSVPPQLQRMRILVNRNGLLRDTGLPECALKQIKTVSSSRAVSLCGDALVGSGRFWAKIVLPEQRPYPTRGRLLIFNGDQDGRQALFAHIFTTKPFATSFVIPFSMKKVNQGRYGTELNASLPEALGTWGYVDRIKLTLRRKYTYRGRRLSYFNAACPAPEGTKVATFPLAHTTFYFADREMDLTLPKSCGVKR